MERLKQLTALRSNLSKESKFWEKYCKESTQLESATLKDANRAISQYELLYKMYFGLDSCHVTQWPDDTPISMEKVQADELCISVKQNEKRVNLIRALCIGREDAWHPILGEF